jgi:RNA polymerase sigma factor (sigma-70 family)
MLRALRELGHYDPARSNNNIFPWLTGLARNEIHRVLGRERVGLSLETLWANVDKELLAVFTRLDSEPFADELLQREETRELVNATMSQLPPHYREALEAKYVAGKSVRDLAGLWRVSEKAAESLLTRARQAFRATFLTLARNLDVELRPLPAK